MLDRPDVTREDVIEYIRATRNWGRWGDDDELGAINLIDDTKRKRAAQLVRTGQSLSLSRPVPVRPAPNNPTPGMMHIGRFDATGAGGAIDFQGMSYHGSAATHIDALCHTWDDDGMWGGRNPDDQITIGEARWGSVDRWKNGILTRGVLIDVPAFRGKPFVTQDEPVHGWELQEIVDAQGVTLEPGDALAIYSGRENYERQGTPWGGGPYTKRPGLEATCLQFIRESDCAVLLWDMFDIRPSRYELVFSTHSAIFAYGVAVIDSALLEPLSDKCRELGTYEFMLSVNPLYVEGATGSLANPIATF